jgi:hypothetical protein
MTKLHEEGRISATYGTALDQTGPNLRSAEFDPTFSDTLENEIGMIPI